VVVPAHNEERLLADCLLALQAAAQVAAVPVTVLVVLDDCADASRQRCQQLGIDTLSIDARNVGVARAAGFQALIGDEADLTGIWLASTDADTRVEPTWLRHQLNLARGGADVVLGVVRLDSDTASAELRQAFDIDYQKQLFPDGSHNHVHGANLGLRASVYVKAGGFPSTPNHEDKRLIQRLRRTPGVIIERTQQLIVYTSGRLDGRCSHGFAATLAALHNLP
jgi:glycosyltransferase involved in cell wall biosynthesis